MYSSQSSVRQLVHFTALFDREALKALFSAVFSNTKFSLEDFFAPQNYLTSVFRYFLPLREALTALFDRLEDQTALVIHRHRIFWSAIPHFLVVTAASFDRQHRTF